MASCAGYHGLPLTEPEFWSSYLELLRINATQTMLGRQLKRGLDLLVANE